MTPGSEHYWHPILHNVVDLYRKSPEQFQGILDRMKRCGEGGIVGNIPFTKDYLDDDKGFEDLSAAAKMIFDSGLNLWLYDELGYPSGAAAGRTTLNRPDLVALGIVHVKIEGNGFNKIVFNKDEDVIALHYAYATTEKGEQIPAWIEGDTVTFDGAEGNWTLYVFSTKKLYEGTHAETNGCGGNNWIQRDYPNLMNADATREFIKNTYVPYATKFKYFDRVKGVFTDEPSLMEHYLHTGDKEFKYAQISWVNGFDTEFEKIHGYSINDNLHHIFEGEDDKSKIVRVNYRQTVAELFAKNYFALLREFCAEHGSVGTGHALLEETLGYHAYYYGDLMRCLREMGSPGIDSLNGRPHAFMCEGWSTYTAAKCASSTNTLQGKDRLCMVEFCAVDFPAFPITEEEIDFAWTTASSMYFSGITHINGYFPVDQMQHKREVFSKYIARISYLSRKAVWDGEVGVYYPINNSQAYSSPMNKSGIHQEPNVGLIDTVGIKLHQAKLDFTILDNMFIDEAEVKDGMLTNGHASFKAVCVPAAEVMPLSVLKKLIALEKAGGKVVWITRTPTLPDSLNDVDELRTLASELTPCTLEEGIAEVKKLCTYGMTINGKSDDLYVGKYVFEGAPMLWFFNRGAEDASFTLSYEGANGYDLYDPETGDITTVNNPEISIEVTKHSTKLLVIK